MFRTCIITLFLMIMIFSMSKTVDAIIKDRQYYERNGQVIWDIKTDKKLVSITFDDGPHPVYTTQILDTLAKYNAKATFFVAGNKVKRFPHVLKRIAKEGHEIGNHTYHHIINKNITPSTLGKELDNTSEIIFKYTGVLPKLYRPVGGIYNETIINTAIKRNYRVILWSWHQDPKDWKRPDAQKIVNHVVNSATPGDIILLHDSGGNRAQTVKALESILRYLSDHNFKFVSVSNLIEHAEEIRITL